MRENKKISFWHPASLICTCFGVGKIPFAPGTWGSLFGFAVLIGLGFLNYAIVMILPSLQFLYIDGVRDIYYIPVIFFLLLLILFLVGWWCSNIYEKKSGEHDSKQIVIDEVVGQLITIVIFAVLSSKIISYADEQTAFIMAVVCFITFRIFDIVKRGPVGWIDKNVKGGLGVMLDDVVAGILAGITSALIFYVLSII